jgi:hypothetical protein
MSVDAARRIAFDSGCDPQVYDPIGQSSFGAVISKRRSATLQYLCTADRCAHPPTRSETTTGKSGIS